MKDEKDKLVETAPRVNGRLTKEEATKRLPSGRPKGAKNKTTLFKEVIRDGFERAMERDAQKVIKAVIEKAILGDMTAAKLLLDRILPTTKAIDLDDLENSKGFSISVNIGNLELPKHLKPDVNVIDVIKEKD